MNAMRAGTRGSGETCSMESSALPRSRRGSKGIISTRSQDRADRNISRTSLIVSFDGKHRSTPHPQPLSLKGRGGLKSRYIHGASLLPLREKVAEAKRRSDEGCSDGCNFPPDHITFHISSAYSLIVRSEENHATLAVLRMAMAFHFSRSAQTVSTARCAFAYPSKSRATMNQS